MSPRKAFRLSMALTITLLAATACITINVPAPTPMPTHTPPLTGTPERGFEIKEKDEPLSVDPELFQFSVTLIGKIYDADTGEEVTSAKVTFITRTGAYTFGSRYELTIPSGSVVRIVIEAPGYQTADVQIKPHFTRNVTIDADMSIQRAEPEEVTPESL